MKEAEETTGAKAEHARLRQQLERATQLSGETAEAARAVLKVLVPHMLKEEEFAIPPVRLLPRLARGELTPEMEKVLPKSEMMKANFSDMLQDHVHIVNALRRLLKAAIDEKHEGYAAFAQKLILHAQQEEEVFYPASILVGEYIKLRLARTRSDD